MLPARRPYPDELASSAIFRCSRQFNVPIKRLGSVCLGREGWKPLFLGASPLIGLAQMFRLAPEDLLWNHTAFPYASITLHGELYGRALSNAFGDAKGGRGLGAVTQNATTGLATRRFCRQCACEELQRYLESYWHRSHNLPGVWVCLRHGCYLLASNVRVAAAAPLNKSMPHQCTGRHLGKGLPVKAIVRVAQLSQQWLTRPKGAGGVPTTTAYRELAVANDWLSITRSVGIEQITSRLKLMFSKRFLLDCGVSADPADWAALMLQPAVDIPFIPVKHAILQTMLAAARPHDVPRLDHFPSGPSASPAATVDDFYARAAKVQLRAALGSGREWTTEQFLKAVGCWGTYRHRMAELPKLRAVVREFRGSIATVKRLRPGKTLYRTLTNECDDASSGG